MKYLCHRGIKLRDFGGHSRQLSERMIGESLGPVERAGRPVIYPPGSQDRKDDSAREMAQRDRIAFTAPAAAAVVELNFEVASRPAFLEDSVVWVNFSGQQPKMSVRVEDWQRGDSAFVLLSDVEAV